MGVYVLHSTVPLNVDGVHAARHYIGWVPDEPEALSKRLKLHRTGRSDVAIVRAYRAIGAKLYLGNYFPFMSRQDERRLKNVGHADKYCEICKAYKAEGYPPRHIMTEGDELWQAIS
jgi:hypothetical protein